MDAGGVTYELDEAFIIKMSLALRFGLEAGLADKRVMISEKKLRRIILPDFDKSANATVVKTERRVLKSRKDAPLLQSSNDLGTNPSNLKQLSDCNSCRWSGCEKGCKQRNEYDDFSRHARKNCYNLLLYIEYNRLVYAYFNF